MLIFNFISSGVLNLQNSWSLFMIIPYVRKFSRLIILVVFVVRKDPRNYSSANINEKMAADGIMYRFCLYKMFACKNRSHTMYIA